MTDCVGQPRAFLAHDGITGQDPAVPAKNEHKTESTMLLYKPLKTLRLRKIPGSPLAISVEPSPVQNTVLKLLRHSASGSTIKIPPQKLPAARW